MTDRLDRHNWTAPPQPLSVSEIQRGVAPVSYVRNERASDPFDTELNHWSALPALSYFALNAVTLRESSRRVAPPSTFRPPPRLTLSDQRRQAWLNELRNPSVSLRALSRAVPHGYTSARLLDMLVENGIPVSRAVWFIKCVGANEVRALKRKHGVQPASEPADHRRIESSWLAEWTGVVCDTVMRVIDSFDACQAGSKDAGGDTRARGSANDDLQGDDTNDTRHSFTNAVLGRAGANENDDVDETSAGADLMDDLFEDPEDVDAVAADKWQLHMEYISRLAFNLYNGSLLDKYAFLEWILNNLRDCSIERLPCFVHLTHLFWEPLVTSSFASSLLRAATHRYMSVGPAAGPGAAVEDSATSKKNGSRNDTISGIITMYFEPLVFRLMTSNEDIFVSPRTWHIIEPHVRCHPAYAKIEERNQAFMLRDPNDPSDWSRQLAIGSLLDDFARPYRINELMTNIQALNVDSEVLVRTILLRTLRQGTMGSITLCVAVLKRLVQRSNDISRETMSEYCVDFLLDPHLVYGSRVLGELVSELVRTRLCHLDLYLRKLISQDVLDESSSGSQKRRCGEGAEGAEGSDGHFRELHLRVLQDLPFDWLPPNLCTQVRILLLKSGRLREPKNLEPLIDSCKQMLAGKPADKLEEVVQSLCANDRHQLSSRLVQAFEEAARSPNAHPISPATLSRLAELMDVLGAGRVKPLSSVLEAAISSPAADPALVKCALRQVHVRLMAFVCSGHIDSLAKVLITKLDALKSVTLAAPSGSTRPNPHTVLQWINWDDISALRAVIQSPSIMCELNAIVPLRQPTSASWGTSVVAHTPVERDAVVRAALYNSGSPDVGALVAMRGDESLSHDIALWAHSPDVDRMALLQLLAYHVVSINELVDTSSKKLELLRFLLLAPSGELGFCFEEIEVLRTVRIQYLKEIPLREILRLIASVMPMDCASRIAHVYPEFYLNDVIIPAIGDPEMLELLRSATVAELRSFEVLLLRCTPFNLRYYQGLVMLAFYKKNPEDIAQEVLDAAYAHPVASSALQGLLQNLDGSVKSVILENTVNKFLTSGLSNDQLPLLDVHYTLIGALASSVTAPLAWSLSTVPEFLEDLAKMADVSDASWHTLRRALALVLRICVIGGLNSVELPADAAQPLRSLLHKQAFADSYKVRTTIADTLRVMQRVSGKTISEGIRDGSDSKEPLRNGASAVDGLRIYSKSFNQYEPLPVWAFDLIQDANPSISKNDGAVDLALFETYED